MIVYQLYYNNELLKTSLNKNSILRAANKSYMKGSRIFYVEHKIPEKYSTDCIHDFKHSDTEGLSFDEG